MKAIILLSIVAIAIASPIDDKKTLANPDISKLPLQKDGAKIDPVKISSTVHNSGGAQSSLHKRDTQSSPVVAAKEQAPMAAKQPTPAAPKQQAPVAAKQPVPAVPQKSNVNNNQKPLYNQPRPAVASNTQKVQPKQQQQPSVTSNAQKSQPIAAQPKPVVAPAQAQASRTRRDIVQNTNVKSSNVQVQKPLEKKPVEIADNTKKVEHPAQGSRVTRDTPKVVDPKASVQTPSTVQQKTVDSTQQKVQQPAQSAPKASDVKSTVQAPSATPQKSATHNHPQAAPVQKTQTQPASPSQLARVPLTSSSARVRRDTQTQSNPSVFAKSDQTKPIVSSVQSPKLNSQASNVRDNSQPLTSSNNNQSPTFVHPVPVEQILKKPANVHASPAATVAKTDTVKIEPALPTTETKTSSDNSNHNIQPKPSKSS